jgi:hypothetical protein
MGTFTSNQNTCFSIVCILRDFTYRTGFDVHLLQTQIYCLSKVDMQLHFGFKLSANINVLLNL